jgi:glycosyltransferase involved in cell wall biosynthesis
MVKSLETLISAIDSSVVRLDPAYIAEVEDGLKEIDLLDSMSDAESDGHSVLRHGTGVAAVALCVARRNGYSKRDTLDACIGGLVHDAGKSLYAHTPYSARDSIDLESKLREQGLLTLGQSVRHNPYLVTADARHHRLAPSQYAVTIADSVTDRSGKNVGVRARQAQTIGSKDIDADFQARFTDQLPYYHSIAKNPAQPIGVTFIERFDGRYPISIKTESQGKLSSLHIARCLGQMGVRASIMAYVEDGATFVTDGVLIDGNNTIEHLDKTIFEDEVVYVTGWTSAFERLKQRAVPANLVMRSILETSLNEVRLRRIQAAGKSCVLMSQESFEKVGLNQEATLIPNGYDSEVFFYEPQTIKQQIFFAGALVPEKGVDHLIKVAQVMPEYEFVVAGSPGMYGVSESLLDMPPNVIRLGEVSQQAIAEQYRRSLVSLVLTDPARIFEVFGKSGVEATLCGCPLVFIANGGLKSNIVSHELTASLDSPDIEGLVTCIKAIETSARNHELRGDLALKAKKTHLTWEQVAARFFARGLDSVVEAEVQKQSRVPQC